MKFTFVWKWWYTGRKRLWPSFLWRWDIMPTISAAWYYGLTDWQPLLGSVSGFSADHIYHLHRFCSTFLQQYVDVAKKRVRSPLLSGGYIQKILQDKLWRLHMPISGIEFFGVRSLFSVWIWSSVDIVSHVTWFWNFLNGCAVMVILVSGGFYSIRWVMRIIQKAVLDLNEIL